MPEREAGIRLVQNGRTHGSLMQSLDALLALIAASHYAGASPKPGALSSLESRLGRKIPREMACFYDRCDGAKLFSERDPPYRFLPLSALCHPGELILGSSEIINGISLWLAFCDVRDGNYVAIDLATCSDDFCNIVDCFHETFPDLSQEAIIANSFREFLDKALHSGGRLYWL
jgi:cell wall assembly regulator SMI1